MSIVESVAESLIPKLGMRRVLSMAGNPLLESVLLTNMTLELFGFDKELKSNEKLAKSMARYLNSCFNAKQEQKKLAWSHSQPLGEILSAFEILSFSPPVFATICAGNGIGTRALERAESYGFSRDSCSFNRHPVGAYLLKDIPIPDILISNMPFSCAAEGKCSEVLNYFTGAPVHHINTPFRYNDPDAIEFLKEELLRLIDVFEKFTGKELDYEKLKSIVKESNEAAKYCKHSLELRKVRPVPISGLDGAASIVPMQATLKGSASFYKERCDELELRIKEGIGIGGEDAIRLMWLVIPPAHHIDIFKDLEKLGAVAVCEEVSSVWCGMIEVKDIIDGLAKRYLENPFNGNLEKRIKHAIEMAKEYEVDAAIHNSIWGCPQSSSGAIAIKDALKEELGIPTLVFDGDPIDPRDYAQGQIRTRIEAFIEMLR